MRHNILETKNYYETYFIDDHNRPTIIIAPGGGYRYTSPRESKPIADFYNKHGYHAVVINYREDLSEFYPLPQMHVSYVIDQMKKDKRVGKVIGIGFSAGGHVILDAALGEYGFDSKLDLLILAYPVVTSDERYWHRGSFENLLGDQFENKDLLKIVSLEARVTKNAPDLFLWGTFTDESVPVMNSLLLLEAYNKAGANAEYHSFYYGGHGLSLCNEETANGDPNKLSKYIGRWASYSIEWLQNKLK